MTATKIANIANYEQVANHINEESINSFGLLNSGIVRNVTDFFKTGSFEQGQTVAMPFIVQGNNRMQPHTEDALITEHNINTSVARMPICLYETSYGWSGQANIFNQPDLLTQSVIQMTEDVTATYSDLVFALLKGVTGVASFATTNAYDISAATTPNISRRSVIQAKAKLGVFANRFDVIAMHSAVYAYLLEKQQTDHHLQSEISDLPTFLNMTVVQDDSIPYDPATNIATTYIFKRGLVGMALVNSTKGLETFETTREARTNHNSIITRRLFSMGLNGASWNKAAVQNTSPSFTDFETSANYSLVYNFKNIPLIAHQHKID